MPATIIKAADDLTPALVRYVDDAQDGFAEALQGVTESALKRAVVKPAAIAGDDSGLFTDSETNRLANAIAGPLAVCELLGRARIRRALAEAMESVATFNEPEDYTLRELIKLLTPQSALDYFRRLIPIRIGDALFGSLVTGQAFTIAATTSTTVRRAVARIITERMETGRQVRNAPREIQEILEAAGVAPKNPQYAEMVWRTNTMEAYRRGSWNEFNDPDVVAMFPVWQYSGIPDGRERMGPLPDKPDHHRWFGKFFDRDVSFWDVRGNEIRDVANCRCNFIPINKFKWASLQKQGAKLTRLAT
jgi:hypothetical protein